MTDPSRYRIAPGTSVRLADYATKESDGKDKDTLKDEFKALRKRLAEMQERLFSENKRSLLLVLQAMDGAGKDSTIRSLFSRVGPQGLRVAAFKKPTEIELSHDFLWRVHQQAPAQGETVVFNRSHYEDVFVVKVHDWVSDETIARRYDHIRQFEELLSDAGTRIVKVLLHVSNDYQLSRMQRRLDRPDKNWKFDPNDLKERKLWDDYMRAFETAIERTSTESAPWYVVPAENRPYRDVVVGQLLLDAYESLDPQYPEPTFDPQTITVDDA